MLSSPCTQACACDVLPVLHGELLQLCVWGNTWHYRGLINLEGLTLCSHFLLLLSPAVASQGQSSSPVSTCVSTKQFKGLKKNVSLPPFFFSWSLALNKLNSSCSRSPFKQSCSFTCSHNKGGDFSHPVSLPYSFKYLSL